MMPLKVSEPAPVFATVRLLPILIGELMGVGAEDTAVKLAPEPAKEIAPFKLKVLGLALVSPMVSWLTVGGAKTVVSNCVELPWSYHAPLKPPET